MKNESRGAPGNRVEPPPLEVIEALPALETVLCTEELNRRPARAPDFEKEARTLIALAQALADSPRTILQTLAETILRELQCESAGVSLLTDDGQRFHWPAIAGLWKPHVGGGTPRDFGPCGDVLDRNRPLMFRHFERRYTYFQPVTPAVNECLLAPFYVAGKAVGTIWAITHHERAGMHKFDNEDLRLLLSLGAFASAAHQALARIHLLTSRTDERKESLQDIREMNEALMVSSVKQHELVQQSEKANVLLRESELRQRFIMDTMPQKMFTAKPNGDVNYFNLMWTEYTGLAFEQIKGWGWTQFIHPDDLEENKRVWQHSIDTGEPFQFEHRVRRSDGVYRWHVSRAAPLRDGDGRIVLWVGSNTDVHDIRQTEQVVRNSEIRYRRLFQAAKDGILILDAMTGKIVDANAFMCGMLGLDLPELLGKELHEIGMFEDEKANKGAFKELQQNGYIRYDHLPIQKPNGDTTQVEFVSNVYREGQRLMAQCNVRDISVRVELERQIKQQTEAMADQHRRKDEFLAMLSHELRNPLAPIRSATHLLRLQARGSDNPIQQQAREVIDRQVTNLTRLVSDLLEISRVVTGRIKMRMEILDAKQVVQHALETARPLIDRQRHEVTLSLPAAPVWMQADATRLEEIVVNLLANAAKYTDDGGRIEMSLEQPGNHALLRVRDSGVGIAKELLPQIFDLFTQADRSLDRAQGGLGIGLNLDQRLVQLHGGTVEAHSAGPGQGSEFVVRLPIVAAPGTAAADAPTPATEAPEHGLRILAVDDNVDACTMLANLLRIEGHSVQTAHTGPAALKTALTWLPDVVLLDIGLPEIDGYEVARRLRAEPALKNTRLIAITGYGNESDVQLSTEAGFDAHLLKPVDLREIEKLLTGWSVARKAAAV